MNALQANRKVAVKNYLRNFKTQESKQQVKSNPTDLAYLIKLIEHIKHLENVSGHLKMFPEDTHMSIDKYPRHKIFFDATRDYREVLFMAANRVGKSMAGAYCTACWATGIYPAWWNGRVFEKETKGWVCANNNQTLKESVQTALLGPPGAIGTGMIPKDSILEVTVKPNTNGMADLILVKNERSKNPSRINTRTYEQGVDKFMGAACDYIWEDEESNSLIHNECMMRVMTTKGIVISTFTPLHGLTPLVMEFKKESDELTEGILD